MIVDELLARIGRVAFEIEEGRRPPELTEAVREMLEDLGRTARLERGDETRRALLADIEDRLNVMDGNS